VNQDKKPSHLVKKYFIIPICRPNLGVNMQNVILKVWGHTISLTPPLLIEVSVPSQESEQSCIYVF